MTVCRIHATQSVLSGRGERPEGESSAFPPTSSKLNGLCDLCRPLPPTVRCAVLLPPRAVPFTLLLRAGPQQRTGGLFAAPRSSSPH